MPREWYDRHAALKIEDAEKRDLYLRILADKKPSFMRYIYPDLSRQYNKYTKNSDRKAQREFGKTVAQLMDARAEDLTDAELSFIRYYRMMLPVGTYPCVMNRICYRFEEEFDGIVGRTRSERPFDYTIMKSGAEYTKSQYQAILHLYEDYNRRAQDYSVFASRERVDKAETQVHASVMRDEFRVSCDKAVPNEDVLCDILLDICYQRNATKQFAWDMCGTKIVDNLLMNSGNIFHVPVMAADGDFEYAGEMFKIVEKGLDECDANLPE